MIPGKVCIFDFRKIFKIHEKLLNPGTFWLLFDVVRRENAHKLQLKFKIKVKNFLTVLLGEESSSHISSSSEELEIFSKKNIYQEPL